MSGAVPAEIAGLPASDRPRRLAAVLALVAFASVALHHGCFFRPASDKVRQITGAQRLLDGQGLNFPAPNLGDLARPWRQPLTGWPPGYSLVFAPVLYVVDDVLLAGALIDTVFIGLFFLAWWRILASLRGALAGGVRLLVWAWWAVAWNPLCGLTSSDILAVALFSWGLALVLPAVDGRPTVAGAVAAGACLAAAAAIRFAYWPMVLVLPVALAAGHFVDRRRGLRGAALASLATSALLVGLLAWAQHGLSGHVTYLSSNRHGEFGLHWENLLLQWPFPVEAAGFPALWGWLARQVSLARRLPVEGVEWLAGLLVLAALTPVLRHGWRQFRPAEGEPRRFTASAALGVAGVLTFLLTVGTLAGLSLLTPADRFGGRTWTYVLEARYYAPALMFLSVGLAYGLTGLLKAPGRAAWAWKLPLVLLLVLTAVLNARERHLPLALYLADQGGLRARVLEQRRQARMVRDHVRRNMTEGRTVYFLTNTDAVATTQAMMAGAVPLHDEAAFRRLRTSGPVVLLALVDRRNRPASFRVFRAQARQLQARVRVALWYTTSLYECHLGPPPPARLAQKPAER